LNDTNDTDEYKVETKFNLLFFKELTGIGFTSSTYGLNNTWITADATGEDAKSIIINKPTIFYYNAKSSIIEGKFLSYTLDNGTSQSLQSYSQFSNIDSLTFPTTTLFFSSEDMFAKGLYEKNTQMGIKV
jgi:predicted ribonuclease toxin of YeeF-YezG toxin-antitoxin module